MKKKVIFAAFAGALFFTTSCSSDDDSSSSNINVADVINTVSSGNWRVSSYIDSGDDETANFTNYNFTFGGSNVLTATNGTNTYTGVWTVTNDDSDDDNPSSDVDFNISFPDPANFAELSDDWDVLERTSTRVRLVDVSGGDGDTDYLTFVKN